MAPHTLLAVQPGTRVTRFAPLDGIRGVAILLVIAHNAGSVDTGASNALLKLWAVVANGGWVGVQLFFALSGFLITRILLAAKGTPGYLQRFYMRRALRIVPVYYALLFFVFVIAPHVASLSHLAGEGARSPLWYWAYLSNWVTPFDSMARALPHVWSLAVEEQFYLVWPLVVLACSARTLAWVCIALVPAALATRVALYLLFPAEAAANAAYQFTITRCDAIALGALVAVAIGSDSVPRVVQRRLPLLIGLSCALLLFGLFIVRGVPPQGTFAEVFFVPLTGVLSALVVLACVVDGPAATLGSVTRLRWLLSSRAFVWVGKYSYAIYVVHLPVRLSIESFANASAIATHAGLRFVALMGYVATVFAISTAIALVSWNVLEAPLLRLKRYFPMPGI